MEAAQETTPYDIFKLYLEADKESFDREYETFKKTNDSLLTDFLDLFIKYKFPCQKIIKSSLDNNKINLTAFFTYFLNEFVDYYKNSLDMEKDVFEEQNFSYIKFFITHIIKDKNDSFENYSYIMYHSSDLDSYYKKYLDSIFKDFKVICIDCINSKNITNNNIINNNNLDYYIKIFDFISILQKSNVIYLDMYNSLKKLFFEIQENKIVYVLDKCINNYKEKQKIQKDIIKLLKDESLEGGYEYFNFINNCFKPNIKSNDNNFINLYLDLLDEEKFIIFIKNNNNNFNLTNIFINQRISNNDQIANVSNNNKGIEKLKRSLSSLTTREYIMQQIKKYREELVGNSKFLYYLSNNNYNYKFSDILGYIDKSKYPFIYEVYSNLLQSLKNSNSNFPGNFGFIVIEKKEYIFAYHNDEALEKILYDANIIKKFEYAQILKFNTYSELLADEKEKSKHSLKSEKNHPINNNNDNETIITSKSEDNIINDKQYEEKEDELNLGYYKGIEFENNSTYLFKNLFDLEELPCYFFYVGEEKTKYQNFISFMDYNATLFNSFIEVDGAFINQSNEKLEPQLDKNFYPFLVQKTFRISEKTSKGNKKYILTLADEKFEIAPKSIIIVESKLSIPKDKGIDIDNFKFYQTYDKNQLDSTMLFTLNK